MRASVNHDNFPIQGQSFGEDFDRSMAGIGRSENEHGLERSGDGHDGLAEV